MITVGDKQLRNLQEQVLKNQDDISILKTSQQIADLGIRIIQPNPLASPDALPTNYEGDYGDAYLVGTEFPYNLYIWTRSNQTGVPGYWFNWGPLNAPSTVPGPMGPIGPQGETGQRGSQWQSLQGQPVISGSNLQYDQALDTSTGDVYQFNGTSWVRIGNIRGPQGIQGIQGEIGPIGPQGPRGEVGPQGPVGEFISIAGELDNIGQLPDPTSVPRSTAYLIPIDGDNHIYLISGTDTLTWIDAGSFAGGSKIRASGNVVSDFDATYISTDDVDIITPISASKQSNGVILDLENNFQNAGEENVTKDYNITIPLVDSANVQVVIQGPTFSMDLTDTAKNNINNKVDKTTQINKVYGTDASGNQTTYNVSSGNVANGVVQRKSDANITVPVTPTANNDAASKQYVDKPIYNLRAFDTYVQGDSGTLVITRQTGIIHLTKEYLPGSTWEGTSGSGMGWNDIRLPNTSTVLNTDNFVVNFPKIDGDAGWTTTTTCFSKSGTRIRIYADKATYPTKDAFLAANPNIYIQYLLPTTYRYTETVAAGQVVDTATQTEVQYLREEWLKSLNLLNYNQNNNANTYVTSDGALVGNTSSDSRAWTYANSNMRVYLDIGTYNLSASDMSIQNNAAGWAVISSNDTIILNRNSGNAGASEKGGQFTITTAGTYGIMWKLYQGETMRLMLNKGPQAYPFEPFYLGDDEQVKSLTVNGGNLTLSGGYIDIDPPSSTENHGMGIHYYAKPSPYDFLMREYYESGNKERFILSQYYNGGYQKDVISYRPIEGTWNFNVTQLQYNGNEVATQTFVNSNFSKAKFSLSGTTLTITNS